MTDHAKAVEEALKCLKGDSIACGEARGLCRHGDVVAAEVTRLRAKVERKDAEVVKLRRGIYDMVGTASVRRDTIQGFRAAMSEIELRGVTLLGDIFAGLSPAKPSAGNEQGLFYAKPCRCGQGHKNNECSAPKPDAGKCGECYGTEAVLEGDPEEAHLKPCPACKKDSCE